MITKIKRIESADSVELMKRTYVPFILEATCPTCGRETSMNLLKEHLCSPELGRPCKVYFACGCDEEWQGEVILDVTLRTANTGEDKEADMASVVLSRANTLASLSIQGLKLKFGELTAGEIRTIRAVLNMLLTSEKAP